MTKNRIHGRWVTWWSPNGITGGGDAFAAGLATGRSLKPCLRISVWFRAKLIQKVEIKRGEDVRKFTKEYEGENGPPTCRGAQIKRVALELNSFVAVYTNQKPASKKGY